VRFQAGVNLDKIALRPDKDEPRVHLCQPYLDLSDPADPRLVAINGVCFAAVAVDLDGDDGALAGPITRGAMKAANSVSEQTAGKSELIATDVVRSEKAGLTFDRPPETNPFPGWRAMIPTRQPTVRVSINAKALHDLARAIDSDLLLLELVPDQNGEVVDPIRVTPFTALDCKAVIMPCRFATSEREQGKRVDGADEPLAEDVALPFEGAEKPAPDAAGDTTEGE